MRILINSFLQGTSIIPTFFNTQALATGISYGDLGDDEPIGGTGYDTLVGGAGNNILTGGKGKDTFLLIHEEGQNLIVDFNPKKDVIGLTNDLSNSAPFHGLIMTFDDITFLCSNITVTATGKVLATLEGFDTTTLTAANFVSAVFPEFFGDNFYGTD